MIGIVVITHGVFGQDLLRTAQDIIGAQEDVLGIALTSAMSLEALRTLIAEHQQRHGGADGILYLVDMLGGTPCNAALLQTKDHPAEIVSGVNLYMMLSAFKNRAALDLKSLAVRVAEDGRKSITLPKDLLAKRAG